MTVFQKLSPAGGGESAAQNYGRADQLRGLEAFIMLIAGVGLVLLSFTYHSSTAFVAWMLLMGLLQHRLRAPQIHHLRSNPPGRTPLALRWNSRRIHPALAVRDRRDSRDLNDDSVVTAFSVSCSTL